jgi:hypothetical protein
MAMAADCVTAEVEEVVPVGVIPPDAVRTSDILVDYSNILVGFWWRESADRGREGNSSPAASRSSCTTESW